MLNRGQCTILLLHTRERLNQEIYGSEEDGLPRPRKIEQYKEQCFALHGIKKVHEQWKADPLMVRLHAEKQIRRFGR